MGFIKIEKEFHSNVNSVPVNVPVTPLNTTESLNFLNNSSDGFEYNFNAERVNAVGMNGEKIKSESSLLGTCISTLVSTTIIVSIIVLLCYLGITYFNSSIELFPHKSNYTADEFYDSLKRCFLILFGIVSFLSIVSMVAINHSVKSRFGNSYLSKFNIWLYDVFIVLLNVVLYIGEMWVMFQVVNNLHSDFVIWQNNGTIVNTVNIDLIELFKYVIVVVMTIFIVLNSFSAVGIVHKQNKFVLDEQI